MQAFNPLLPWQWFNGDSRDVMKEWPSNIFHCAITSPPYWKLRDYKVKGQIGLEETPGLFLQSLIKVFAQVQRVLRPDGLLFVNLGDTYGQDGQLQQMPARLASALQEAGWILRSEIIWRKPCPMPESLMGWRWEKCRVKKQKSKRSVDRYGQCENNGIDSDLGQLGGAEWADCPGCPKCNKTNGLILRKGSWRPTRAHEFIYMFSKTNSYFADGEPLRTRLAEATIQRDQYTRILDDPEEQFAVQHDHETQGNPAGANRRDVWPMDESALTFLQKALDSGEPHLIQAAEVLLTNWNKTDVWDISPEPMKLKHYAAFPPELPRLCINASCSEKGVCGNCGGQWARVLEVKKEGQGKICPKDEGSFESKFGNKRDILSSGLHTQYFDKSIETTGFRPTCNCPDHSPIPPLILDPFGGVGTTVLTARRMGCRAVGIELSEDYSQMAVNRIKHDNPLFNSF